MPRPVRPARGTGLAPSLWSATISSIRRRAAIGCHPAIAFELTALLDARTAPLRTLANDDADDGRPDVFDTFDQRELRPARDLRPARTDGVSHGLDKKPMADDVPSRDAGWRPVLEAAHIVPL